MTARTKTARTKRTKSLKVRFTDDELQKIKDANIVNVAKFLRESALAKLDVEQGSAQKKKGAKNYSKIDRDYVLELSKIGGNLNQITRAINIDLVRREPLNSAKLLHLLIGIDRTLKSMLERDYGG